MTKFAKKCVLITGGAAGIGKLMGRNALQLGAKKLIVWDINEKAMADMQIEFEVLGQLHTYRVDVSDVAQIRSTAERMLTEGHEIDILINNAGIVVGKEFWDNTHDDISKTMAINSNALMHTALCFLPGMIQRNSGHIVNIASAAGMLSNPRMAVYASSKWAVIGWSESLRLELRTKNRGVRVTTVTPSYIDTGMFDGVKTHWILPIVKPDTAARKIIRAVEGNRVFLRMPWSVYLLPFFKGLLPVSWFDLIVGRWLKVYKSMQHFKGHKS